MEEDRMWAGDQSPPIVLILALHRGMLSVHLLCSLGGSDGVPVAWGEDLQLVLKNEPELDHQHPSYRKGCPKDWGAGGLRR